MRLGLGEIAPNKNQRNVAWACFFRVIKEEARYVLEALHELLPQYRAAIRVIGKYSPEMTEQIKKRYPDTTDFNITERPEWASLYMELQEISKGESPWLEPESVVLAEALASWQRQYNLTGAAAFERALGLLSDWSFGELKEEMPIYDNFGPHRMPTDLPQPPVYSPPYMTAADYKELVEEYMKEVEATYANFDYPDNDKWRQVKVKKKTGTRDFRFLVAHQIEGLVYPQISDKYPKDEDEVYDVSTISRGIKDAGYLLGLPLRKTDPGGRPRKPLQ